jgi:hypothetical protein
MRELIGWGLLCILHVDAMQLGVHVDKESQNKELRERGAVIVRKTIFHPISLL